MSFRSDILSVVDDVRSIAGPEGLDIRTNQLTIRRRVYSGSFIGDGTATDTDLVLPARYPVKHLLEAEVSGSGGNYETGDVLVDHITPSNGAGVGYTRAQLDPVVTAQNQQTIYLMTGDHAGEYSLVECRTFRPFTYQLVLRRTRNTP